MKHRGFLIASAVVIFAAAAALAITLWPSSGPSWDGPFGMSGPTTAASCIPIPGRVITYGVESVKNSGPSDATIVSIGYDNPHNLQVLQAFTIPVHGYLYGGRTGYPPRWMLAERTSVIRPGHEYNVIIVTRLTGQEGHADAVLVNYTEHGTQYRLRTIAALAVKYEPPSVFPTPFPSCPVP
jgi:hypothetical protein